MKLAILITTLIATSLAGNCTSSPGIPNATFLDGFCGWTFASNLNVPRGLEVLPNGDLLVLSRGSGSVLTQLWEEADGSTNSTVIFSGSLGLNHAVRYHQGYVWASSDTTVYRWNWTTPRAPLGTPETILTGMPPAGNHNTRTLEFNGNFMYINVGSQNNIDQDSSRARIVRTLTNGTLPKQYGVDTQVYADGTRNVVGLRLDNRGRLWGVENGIDNIGNGEARSDLGNVAQYNPAEEVNIFTDENMGRFYGYPYCWSEGLTPDGRPSFAQATGNEGTQWSTYNTVYNDSWCRDTNNVIPPAFTAQAHHAPLDIIFLHDYSYAVFTSHGTNRSVLLLPLDSNGNPAADWNDLQYLVHGPFNGLWSVTPVALAYAPCQSYGMCLYFSDDSTGSIYVIAMNDTLGSSTSSSISRSTSSDSSGQVTHFSEGSNTQSTSNDENSGAATSVLVTALLVAAVVLLY